MAEKITHCKSCNTELHGEFCSNCGQKLITKRFTLGDSLTMAFDQVFNLHQGILFTTKELLVAPQRVTLSFINGVTKKYFHPFRFIFVWASLSTLINYVFDSTSAISDYMGMQPNDFAGAEKVGKIVEDYLTLIIMGAIPFFSLFTKLFFRTKKLNFTEHLIINAYANGLTSALGILLYALYAVPAFLPIAFFGSNLLNFVGGGYVFAKTFDQNIIWASIKYFLAFVCAFLLIMVFSIIGGIIYAATTGGFSGT